MDSRNSLNDVVNSEAEYFKYADADCYQNEIAELYSYTECSEVRQNFRAYVIEIDQLKGTSKWLCLEAAAQRNFIMSMIDRLDVSDHIRRMLAARCILYLAQGCWMEVKTAEAQQECTRANVLLLYRLGAFSAFINLFNIELEKSRKAEEPEPDGEEAHVTMHDSMALRLIINVLYTLIETIRVEKDKGNPEFTNIATDLISELSSPMHDGELFQIKLLNMLVKYCNGSRPHFPIKKLVLLLWKSTLLGLGGIEALKQQKTDLRLKAGLRPIANDTLEVANCMQATVLIEEDTHVSRKMPIIGKRIKTASFESNEDASAYLKRQMAAFVKTNKLAQRDSKPKESSTVPIDVSISPKCVPRSAVNAPTPKANSSSSSYYFKDSGNNGLLLEPKVRNSDIEKFLQNAREKFIGFSFDGDHKTLIGLPKPILESVQALQRHLYVSLSELQITAEEQQSKRPNSSHEVPELSPTERFYQAMLPNMSDYVHDLLRLHQAASPTAKLTAGNVNSRIITDMLPKNLSQTAIFSSTMKSDVLRHKEIIVKAISAFLLLCLKHFKLNHIYHSEYMCQLLFQSGYIKQVLQFFTPSVSEYVQSTTNIPAQDFPACVIAQEHDNSSLGDAVNEALKPSYSWRNLFACVNLLRLLNKVVKWKPSRIVNMVFLKSANTLKESLKVQQPLLQVYALKLLKMQAKFLGRNWRRHNLKVLTAIYTKVRPRFNDDWAYGCKTVGDFWGAQEDEMDAFSRVKDYHLRRFPHFKLGGFCANTYKESMGIQSSATDLKIQKSECYSVTSISHLLHEEEKPLTEISNNLKNSKIDDYKSLSLSLMEPIEPFELSNDADEDLPEDFKKNYEVWLENQVFNCNFDWDSI